MADYCACGSCGGICECKDNCYCCVSICDCVPCFKIRKTQPLCEKCGHGASCHRNKIIESDIYPGVRFDQLPNLDFLNPKPASGATGHSSEKKVPPAIPIGNNSRRQDSHNSSPEDDSLIFQMDDIDTSLPPVSFNVEVAPGTFYELPATTYTEAINYSPSKSSQRDNYSQSTISNKCVLPRNSISPKIYPNRMSKSEQQISEDSKCLRQNSHSQFLKDKVLSETETQPPCTESKEMQTVSALEHSSEKIQPDRQESSMPDFKLQERNSFVDSHSQLRTDKVSPETKPRCSESKEMQKVSSLEHSFEKIKLDQQESSNSDFHPQERNSFVDSESRTDKISPETDLPYSESKEMPKVSDPEHSLEKIQRDRQEPSKPESKE